MPALPAREYASMLENLDIYFISSKDDLELLRQGLHEIAADSSRYVGLDTETTGLDPVNNRVRLIQVATEKAVVVIDLDAFRADASQRAVDWSLLPELKSYLEKTKKRLVIHNSSFDINFLQREGINFRTQRIYDTMIASRLINNGTKNRNSLEEVVKRRLGLTLDKTEQKSDFSGPLSGDQIQYAAVDAAVLPMLAPVLDELLYLNAVTRQKSLHSVFELEMECVIPISLMRHQGFQFDLEKAKALRGRLASEAEHQKVAFCEALDKRLKLKKSKMRLPREADGSLNLREKTSGSIRLGTKVYAGFNPRSTKQMIEAFHAAKIQLKPNDKGKLSLDQNLLAFLRPSVPLIDEYLNWKEKATLVSAVTSLIEACDADGRIHADYKQVGTETGRLSCAEPNLQQVPKEAMFRELFIAAPGKILICADFSQIELRVAAFLSREPLMIDAYNQGRDLHMETAALMTRKPYDQVTKQERTSAKICNFGLLYGAGPATLRKQAMAQYGVLYTLDEARALVENFRAGYPTLFAWQKTTGEATTASLYTVSGRRRIVQGTFNDKFTTRVNTEVQGSAGDIAKKAMGLLWKEMVLAPDGEAALISMVHDEIVLEVDEDKADIWSAVLKDAMESAGQHYITDVPILAEVGVGPTWADAK